MTIAAGSRLGPYEIMSALGAGGMGEVYRARDAKLNRDVALKVLPELFALDVDRLARFKREAQVLASLNHPNIAAIYGFEESNNVRALVMELVEGEDLSAHIARGPMPLADALPIARQIAEALEAAHEQGIIHRDLTPANIKVRPDGTVKLLDFGLAKALVSDGPSPDLSQAATRTAAGTREGLILGTPAYMSPEQARGTPVDKRTDVWAFGCVLYQVLTGRKAFSGNTVSDVIAAILEREPNWEALPARTPAPIRRLLRRCLERDRKRRLRDMGDALADIEEASNPRALEVQAPPSAASWLGRYTVLLATTAVGAAIVTALTVSTLTRPTSQPPTRFTIPAPPSAQITRAVPALSPDGRTLVFAACTKCNTEDLDDWVAYRRPLDRLQEVPIPAVKGAFFFFFSPDGRSLGFCTRDGLKKVSLAGGPPVTLYEGTVLGADWGADDTIVFGSPSGLMRISAAGGKPQPITTPTPGKGHMWPTILPRGSGVLFTVWDGSPNAGTGQIAVASLETRKERILMKGSGPRFSATGHVIFGREGSLWAVPFDERRLNVTGEAVPVLEGAAFQSQFGLAGLTVARNGSLAYLTGDQPKNPARALVWVSRQGHEEASNLPAASYGWARVSPDGTSIALDIVDSPGNANIWTYDIARRTRSKLTDGPGLHLFPLWTQDSQRVVFAAGPPFSFFSQRVGATEPARPLIATDVAGASFAFPPSASSWSRDGKMLVFNYLAGQQQQMGENAPFDIGVLTTNGNGAWTPLLHAAAAEVAPAISPDGAWIAYSSNRTGRFEIYVERFPDLGGQIVSTSGGDEPLWSPSGNEIFYRSLDGRQFLSVPFDAKSGRARGGPTVLFEGPYASYLGGFRLRAYDVTPDGKRFVMLKELPGTGGSLAPTQLTVVLNWFEELKQRVPTK